MPLQIPAIDVSSGLDHPRVIQQLSRACADWGFFQIQGHGISSELRRQLFAQMVLFFALPAVEKQHLRRTAHNFWGYYDKELTKNKIDRKEIFDIDGNLDNLGADSDTAKFRQTSSVPWPESLPTLKPAVLDWLRACESLSHSLLAAICSALNDSPDVLNPFFLKDHTSFLRFNYYPCTDYSSNLADTNSATQLGIHPHTDAGALTVLAQDSIAGLQVRKNDNWHMVIPASDSLIINIGDMMQVWSNDRFIAPEHRVLASGDLPRYSVPYFYNPSYETICQPLLQNAAAGRYRPISWGEYRHGRAAGDYADLGEEIQIAHFRE